MNYNIIKLLEFEDIENLISKVDSYSVNNDLIIEIKTSPNTTICSFCNSTNINIKEYKKVKITHSISMTKSIYILFHRRRYKCKTCGKTFYEHDPFTDHKSRLSNLTIINILEYLKDVNHSFTGASKYYNTSINTVINVFDRYITAYRNKLPEVLCIDEVHIKSNVKYPYACVLLDFHTSKIVDVLKTRHKDYLTSYFESFDIKELDNVKYVVMDLWSPYKDVIKRLMPKAKIIADAFHVVTNINRILDKKRTQVMNNYRKQKNDNLNYSNDFGYLLKRFSWLIRYNRQNVKGKNIWIDKYRFSVYSYDLLNHLLSSDNELKEIYNIKHIYQDFNSYTNIDTAKEKLLDLINIFRVHEITEIREYGRTLNRWKDEIINSFTKYDGKRYSNGRLESINRQIKTIIRNSFGITNFKRFRARVMYSINKNVPIDLRNK
ncbi:MAG: ISL3 family transposase [Acholeplasma sp.]|nr:ISL3 family transposase [Acholeplasma sp.]